MSTPYTPNFLRRTAVALAAAAGLLISVSAIAQNNVLKRSTGETVCTYSGLSVTPNGNIVVTCDTSTPNPDPNPQPNVERFSISSSPSSLGVTESGLVLVTRVNGTNGVAAINYTITGGCAPATGIFWTQATSRMTTPVYIQK